MHNTQAVPPSLDALRQRREEILTLVEQYGGYNVRVFGSVARGEATVDSDVDLLVSFKAGTSLFDVTGLWLDLQDLLGREVSLVSDGIQDDRFLGRIAVDVVAL